MSFSILVDRAQRVLLVRFGQTMTTESLTAMRAAVRRFAETEKGYRAIVDFSAVTVANVPGHFIADLARSGPIIKNEMRILVAPKPEIFGLSRMYELHQFSTADNTLVVRTLAEALEALGVEALDLVPMAKGPDAA
jgi:hypothetical protein